MSQRDKASSAAEQKTRETFDHYDKDGSGFIDRSEFGHLLDSLGARLPQDERAAAWKKIDDDGDDKMSFAEFWAWWSKGH